MLSSFTTYNMLGKTCQYVFGVRRRFIAKMVMKLRLWG